MTRRALSAPKRTWLAIDDLEVEVRFRRMKTLRLHVEPPDGRVWVSAPHFVGDAEIVSFVVSNRSFIDEARARQRAKLEARSHHHVRLLGVEVPIEPNPEREIGGRVQFDGERVIVSGAAIDDLEVRERLLDEIKRQMLADELARMMPEWEARIGRKATWWGIRRMKTRWGSCTHRTGRIRYSLNLGAQHPREIEYVVVHELAHLIVPNHGPDFHALMDQHLPDWPARKRKLNGRDDLEPD